MIYKVKDVAQLAGISVRTLHHYDHIGLLVPDAVAENGYRLYSEKNLLELQQIMFLRELEFPLKSIAEMMSDPEFGGAQVLLKQRELLLKKRERLDKIIRTIDKTIASQRKGFEMKKQDMFEAFDMKEMEEQQQKFAAELKEKYGSTDAYRESSERVKKYKEEDWAVIKAEADSIMQSLAGLMGKDPGDTAVQAVIAQWQQHITDRYYNCTREILAGLGESYVDDERFTKNIDSFAEGLALFFRDAIRIYCK